MDKILQFLRDLIDEFTDIIKEIIMPRTVFAAMFYITFCYLILKGRDVPEALLNIVSTLMGFWFGNRVGSQDGKSEQPKENKNV